MRLQRSQQLVIFEAVLGNIGDIHDRFRGQQLQFAQVAALLFGEGKRTRGSHSVELYFDALV